MLEIARLVYSMLKNGTEFTDVGQEYYELSNLDMNLSKQCYQFRPQLHNNNE
jgi:hypothetical protein